MLLQHCWSRRARRPSETLVPEAWGSAVAPVMGAGATALTRGKAQRMGSEPFQFTDAPFHLRAEGQKESQSRRAHTGAATSSRLAHLNGLSPGAWRCLVLPSLPHPSTLTHNPTHQAPTKQSTKAPKTAGGAGHSFIHSLLPQVFTGNPPVRGTVGSSLM